MKRQHQVAGVLSVGLLAGVLMSGCSSVHDRPQTRQVVIDDPNLIVPYVEEVRYTKWSTGQANELEFVINTGRGWAGKRDCFGKHDRCSYLLTLPSGTNTFAASEVDIKVSLRPSAPSFHPQAGQVTITGSDSGSLAVSVQLEDERLPGLMKGTYTLTADNVHYSFQRRP